MKFVQHGGARHASSCLIVGLPGGRFGVRATMSSRWRWASGLEPGSHRDVKRENLPRAGIGCPLTRPSISLSIILDGLRHGVARIPRGCHAAQTSLPGRTPPGIPPWIGSQHFDL